MIRSAEIGAQSSRILPEKRPGNEIHQSVPQVLSERLVAGGIEIQNVVRHLKGKAEVLPEIIARLPKPRGGHRLGAAEPCSTSA